MLVKDMCECFISSLSLHLQEMQIGAQVGRKHDLEEQLIALNSR